LCFAKTIFAMLQCLLPDRFVETSQDALRCNCVTGDLIYGIRAWVPARDKLIETPENRLQFVLALSGMAREMQKTFPDETQRVEYVFGHEQCSDFGKDETMLRVQYRLKKE
jgi:hypothetical protein